MCTAATREYVAVVEYLYANLESNCKMYDPNNDAFVDFQGRVECTSCVHGFSGDFGNASFWMLRAEDICLWSSGFEPTYPIHARF